MSETVQTYIDKHSLQKKVEDVLNSTVKAKPEEPLSFMVRVETTHDNFAADPPLDPSSRHAPLHPSSSSASSSSHGEQHTEPLAGCCSLSQLAQASGLNWQGARMQLPPSRS